MFALLPFYWGYPEVYFVNRETGFLNINISPIIMFFKGTGCVFWGGGGSKLNFRSFDFFFFA